MPVTGIQFVKNNSTKRLLFQRAESNALNRYILESPAPATDVDNCWVPWCSSAEDFPKTTITILSMPDQKVLGYIWQDHDSNGNDRVRFSTTGWSSPSPSNQIPGDPTVGIKINLIVEANGSIKAERATSNT